MVARLSRRLFASGLAHTYNFKTSRKDIHCFICLIRDCLHVIVRLSDHLARGNERRTHVESEPNEVFCNAGKHIK